MNAITYFYVAKEMRFVKYACKSVLGTSDLIKIRDLADRARGVDLVCRCQGETDASRDIFSLNGAFNCMDRYYVVGTDNHRLINLWPNGGFISTVGFNVPTSIFPISN